MENKDLIEVKKEINDHYSDLTYLKKEVQKFDTFSVCYGTLCLAMLTQFKSLADFFPFIVLAIVRIIEGKNCKDIMTFLNKKSEHLKEMFLNEKDKK